MPLLFGIAIGAMTNFNTMLKLSYMFTPIGYLRILSA